MRIIQIIGEKNYLDHFKVSFSLIINIDVYWLFWFSWKYGFETYVI